MIIAIRLPRVRHVNLERSFQTRIAIRPDEHVLGQIACFGGPDASSARRRNRFTRLSMCHARVTLMQQFETRKSPLRTSITTAVIWLFKPNTARIDSRGQNVTPAEELVHEKPISRHGPLPRTPLGRCSPSCRHVYPGRAPVSSARGPTRTDARAACTSRFLTSGEASITPTCASSSARTRTRSRIGDGGGRARDRDRRRRPIHSSRADSDPS